MHLKVLHPGVSHLETGRKFTGSWMFIRISTKFQLNGCPQFCIEKYIWNLSHLKRQRKKTHTELSRRWFPGWIDHFRPFLLQLFFRIDLRGVVLVAFVLNIDEVFSIFKWFDDTSHFVILIIDISIHAFLIIAKR